jgi:phospholipase/lecithinase/hemolysin
VHDLGYTPYAIGKNDTTLISCMTAVFNARVRVDPIQDGRLWGLILADDDTVAAIRSPGSFGLVNTTGPACTVPSPACSINTLVPGATTGNFLWADDRHFGPAMHNQLANQALTRARNSPF